MWSNISMVGNSGKFGSRAIYARIKQFSSVLFWAVLFGITPTQSAWAFSLSDIFNQTDLIDLTAISENIITSIQDLPGLLTAIAYLLGLLFGVLAVLKFKDHVENPAQTPIRTPIIRLLVGGSMFALPIVFEAMRTSIGSGDFDSDVFSLSNLFSGIMGEISGLLGNVGISTDFNFILGSIISSVRGVPGLISGAAYMLGLLFGVLGLIKIKDHVESPEQTSMKEGVIRLLIGGAMFALPAVFEAMKNTIIGDPGFGSVGGIINALGELSGILDDVEACGLSSSFVGNGGGSLGKVLCNVVNHTGASQAFLTAISYLFGLVLGFWGLLKVQDHVLNPQQTSIWEGIARFIAGGAFFALPLVTEAMSTTVVGNSLMDPVSSILGIVDTLGNLWGSLGGGGGAPVDDCAGLDGAISCFVDDIFKPFMSVLNLFGVVAGTILIMIGISRLLKSAQEGARAPGGLGTMMTFITGGLLISYNQILGAFSTSFFGGADTVTYGVLQYSEGMTDDELEHAHIVISAILQFMIIIGLISFVRGIFIVRGVAEGDQQSSLMSGVTHMVGGALAVNLGPLMNAVQTTLGLTEFGIMFGA